MLRESKSVLSKYTASGKGEIHVLLRASWLACLMIWVVCAAQAENWPAWRGPRGDGTSLEKNPPTRWSATENIVWKTPIPGLGHSSPIIWGDRIFLTTAINESQERVLLCLERKSGMVTWQQTVLKASLEAKNNENSYASSTPVTDGELVYVTFLQEKEVVVAAYDFSGKQLWLARPGTFYSQWGFSHTPVLFEDKVIVVCDSKGENFIVALNRKDGQVAWKTPRTSPSQSYSAPLIREMAGRTQMIVSGNKAATSYDPKTGKLLWVVDMASSDSVVTPVYNERAGLVLTSSSWPDKILMAIKPDGEGNVTTTKVAWSGKGGAPYVPSPLSVEGLFFTAANNQEGHCFDAATGNILWHEAMGKHHASPVLANGLVYFLNDDGVAHVVKAASKYELVARNEIGEKTYASLVFSEGQVFLRSFKNLYCIGAGK
jgi:outer membrane protein assembly factor BamB